MRRTDLMDTSEWAHREMVRRLRRKTPGARLAYMVRLCETGAMMAISARERRERYGERG